MSSGMEDSPTSTKPVLVGIIVDVSNSMRRNWKNTEGKSLPKIEIVRDSLNERIKKLQLAEKMKGRKRQNIDMFCIGMGFKAPLFWNSVELTHDQEHLSDKIEKRTYVGLVCDLLALSEILPNNTELAEFKQKLNQKWSIYTKDIFDKATIKEDVYTQLKHYLQEELYKTATQNLHKSVFYRTNIWASARIKTIERYSPLLRLFKTLSSYILKREEKNKNVSQAAAVKYFENIIKLANSNFTKNQTKYAQLIEKHLNQFIQTYIILVLRALTLGFEIPELVAYLDEDKVIKLAKKIYDDLDTEVRNNIALAWIDNRKDLFLSRRSIGGSLDKRLTKQFTERCIQKCGWSILKPFIHKKVLNMFVEQFEIQAKEALPDWIRLASTREVTRSIRQISTMLPDVIEHHIYSQEVMFGTTPFREALDKASIRLLDKTYKNREKVLIVISDGEFEERQSALLSADLLKQRGVTIISCLVADKNIVTQLIEQFKGTRSGAQLMFEIASEANKKVQLVPENKDQKTSSKKLFYQINTSQILNDVIGAAFP